MQYMGDAAWWDKRFAARQQPLPPDDALIRHMERLKPGKVLDIACGDGRNALYLAQSGFLVTGVDFSAGALNRLHAFADERGLHVDTKLRDLSTADAFEGHGIYDSVVINHYRLPLPLVERLPQHVGQGATIWINGFFRLPKNNPAITERELIKRSDYASMEPGCRLVLQEEYESQLGHFLTLIYERQ